MFNKILILCQGNICRSPLAEGFLKFIQPNLQVTSAGITAMVDWPADPTAQRLAIELGIDISTHLAKQVTPSLLQENELILVMDKQQEKEIILTAPYICGKVYRLGKWGDFDVPDPYRRSDQTFELAFNLIKQGLSEWQKKL